ncbi:MAG TPA: hypothetical protein VE377_09110 [Candidatus Dormibacteraeota bacterium]|nr:hypothetical protein [Candidatus Dormibacteraeota bacterium]
MAVPKHTATQTAKTHAAHFCESLSPSQRNALRTIMHHEGACSELKHALGIQKVYVVSEHSRRTGKAMQGRTIDLFTRHTAQDIAAR